MKKPVKIVIVTLGVLAIIGICFGCLAIYAKIEINKPKFTFPKIEDVKPLSELPKTNSEAYGYVSRLYEKASGADNVEGSWNTSLSIKENDLVSPLSASDAKVFSRALKASEGFINEQYASGENVLLSKTDELPVLGFSADDVIDFSAVKGYTDEYGEDIDDGYYYITLSVDPDCIDTEALSQSDIRKSVEKELADAAIISSLGIKADSFEVSFKIAYYNDMLIEVKTVQEFTLKVSAELLGDYSALSDRTAEFEIPYSKKTEISLMHYGIHFTERQIALKPGDVESVPLEVRVNAETTSDGYTLTFSTSKDGILDIDPDGVINVLSACDDPVTVTAELVYGGHTYTDSFTVYATELEVSEDE